MSCSAFVASFAASALWAQNHVGQPVPKYITGDECLFCHRVEVADTWEQNPHSRTIHLRDSDDRATTEMPAEATHILGARPPFRGLKEDGYGKFDLLSPDAMNWDREAFAEGCAGCHATAVDAKTRTFASSSLDCYTCHGAVPKNHPNDISLVWFSKKHEREPKQIVSICGQCHLRGGKSKTSGRPYPNNFIAGDNLFEDFVVDFSKVSDETLNPADRHIYRNARDVVRDGGTVNCISCHKIHDHNTARHRFLDSAAICLDCHNAGGPKKAVKSYTVHSAVCAY